MKFSEKWLREWINLKIKSNVLYEQIVNSGIEIESIKKFNPIFKGIVVGQIIKCVSHPQSKKLKILKVDIGKKKILNIVCGAPNCRDGIKVAVATVGSILPQNTRINLKILKGELSEGMLCSFFELGIFDENNKIIEFSEKTIIGVNINNYLLLKDNIIKVSITSNRPDGLSILGLSRNIAAINNLKTPSLVYKHIYPVISNRINININNQISSHIKYAGRIINGIDINVETPFWMKKKLFFSDNLSVNVVTNIINYILIELGQPLNVFNIDNVNGDIIIRMAKNKENIILKNNLTLSLDENILVFSDINKILSLPGNINSYSIDIDNNTTNIFLSSFLFDNKFIVDILKTNNSNKILEYYKYGIDPMLQRYVIEYATDLIIKICGGKPGPIIDNKSSFPIHIDNIIRLYHDKCNKIIGCFIDVNIISNILYNLNYKFTFKNKFWDVIPPSWRFDIILEEDVISDILRIYGYNNINTVPLQEYVNCSTKSQFQDVLLKKLSLILINQGYCEVINYGFVNPKIHNVMFPYKSTKQLLLSNPISQDMSSMRLSLWPGLLKNVSYNKNRQQQSIRLFESGLCFLKDSSQNLNVKQEFFLAAVISGNYLKENWYQKTRKMDFYDLKGDLETLLESICNFNDVEFRPTIIPGLHPNQSASIYLKNILIGSIGAIDPKLEKELNVNSSTFLFEISLNYFSDIKLLKIQEISKFPTIRRDIAILISENVLVSDVIKTCKNFFINQTVEINLFDLYSCKEFFNKKKSLGISFIFQNRKRTLEDNEVTSMLNDCITILKKQFKIILRK